MSIEMAQIGYRRLQSTARRRQAVGRAGEASLDAWALVDTLNRQRVLISHMSDTEILARPRQPRMSRREAKASSVSETAAEAATGDVVRHRVTTRSLVCWTARRVCARSHAALQAIFGRSQ